MKELEYEIEQKNKVIKDLQKEKKLIEKRTEEECAALREEVDLLKEKNIQLSRNESQIEVYKRKIQDLVTLKADLKMEKESNQRLREAVELLEKDRENYRNL